MAKRKSKIIYSDGYGSITESRLYRGAKGRFVSAKYGRRAIKAGNQRVYEIIEQWRLDAQGKRLARVLYSSPDTIEKATMPGAVADSDGQIYDALRTTNLLTQIHKAGSAKFVITGFNNRGEYVSFQGEVESFGKTHQSEQLVYAIENVLENNGYGDPEYYTKSGNLIKYIRGRGGKVRVKTGLQDVTITVRLSR